MIIPRTTLTLMLAIAAIASTSQSAQAQSISPEFKAILEAADLKYKITGEDAVEVDLKFKPPGQKRSVEGVIHVSPVNKNGNLKSRQLRVGLYRPGQPLPKNVPWEMLLQTSSTPLFCFGSAVLNNTPDGNGQFMYRRDVNDDEIRRHPEEFRKSLGFALKCAQDLKNQIER
jgi:hypothetical protein